VLGLEAQTYPRDLYEVLIVLNEPHNRGLEVSTALDCRVLWEPRYFSYATRNLGIQEARGEFLLFTDSDTTPDQGWIEEGIRALRQGADIVAGKIAVTSSARPSLPEVYELLYAFDQEKNVRGGYCATANMVVRRDLFTTLGHFDRTALSGEDFLWTRRAVESGARLVYARACIVNHPARSSWSALLAKARRTTLPYVGVSSRSAEGTEEMKRRFVFQLRTKPSRERAVAFSPGQRIAAAFTRRVLMFYKALCLTGFSPTFRKDQQTLSFPASRLALASPGGNR